MSKSTKLVRLDISPYQGHDFEEKEKILAQEFDLKYKRKIPEKGSFILITNTHTDVSSIKKEEMNRCLLHIHPNSGYDNISQEYIKKAKFPIILGNPIRANPVAQYIISCLMDAFNRIPFSKEWKSGRQWSREALWKKRILILGHGHIGKKVSAALKGLDLSLRIFDPQKGYVTNLKEEIEQADIIIPLCSLNEDSYHILGQESFSTMKKNIVIINGARGKLIDQQALLKFLIQNPQARAYLDVYEKEPFSQGLFDELENVYLTSHIAGVFKHLDQEILDFEKEVLRSYFNKNNLRETYPKLILNP